jgi:hypothetical protein
MQAIIMGESFYIILQSGKNTILANYRNVLFGVASFELDEIDKSEQVGAALFSISFVI